MRFALWISQLPRGLEISSWTFLKSTQKELLKNVLDEISRPLGSREIHKAKRIEGFFLITLSAPCFSSLGRYYVS